MSATHVVLDIDEYERLLRAAADPLKKEPVEWIDARDAAAEIAASWIVQARRRAGLTQQELADRVGMPQSQISRIERNADRTTVRTLRKIANALNVNAAELLTFAARR